MLQKLTKYARNSTSFVYIFHIFSTFDGKITVIPKKSWKILDYPLFLHYKFATIKIKAYVSIKTRIHLA
jgi:hypothetical protein